MPGAVPLVRLSGIAFDCYVPSRSTSTATVYNGGLAGMGTMLLYRNREGALEPDSTVAFARDTAAYGRRPTHPHERRFLGSALLTSGAGVSAGVLAFAAISWKGTLFAQANEESRRGPCAVSLWLRPR